MWKLALLAICTILAAGPCYAQTVSAASGADSIDTATMAAARRVVAANGSANSYALLIDRMVPHLMRTIAPAYDLTEAQTATAITVVSEEMRASSSEFIELTTRVYAQRMSAADLNFLADFYESPTGQRYIQTLPAILNDSITLSNAWAENVLVPRVTARILELRDQGRL